jgi:hypothetical protein
MYRHVCLYPDGAHCTLDMPHIERVGGALTAAEIIADLKITLHTLPKRWPRMFNMRAVVDHGRPYVGMSRPKGYRKQAAKRCFWNAAKLALDNRGTYVEGYASFHGTSIHHAWVTLDDEHAIDVTWDNPADCHYVGIAFPKEIVSRYGPSQGCWVSLLSDSEPSAALRELLAAASTEGAHGPA